MLSKDQSSSMMTPEGLWIRSWGGEDNKNPTVVSALGPTARCLRFCAYVCTVLLHRYRYVGG